LARVTALAFGCNQDAGIEDYSHTDASTGSRWLATAASTSLAKSASIVAVESSGSNAMHSEIVRRGGVDYDFRARTNPSQQRTKATGCFSLRNVKHPVSHGVDYTAVNRDYDCLS
jgi:hypothetical protein